MCIGMCESTECVLCGLVSITHRNTKISRNKSWRKLDETDPDRSWRLTVTLLSRWHGRLLVAFCGGTPNCDNTHTIKDNLAALVRVSVLIDVRPAVSQSRLAQANRASYVLLYAPLCIYVYIYIYESRHHPVTGRREPDWQQ